MIDLIVSFDYSECALSGTVKIVILDLSRNDSTNQEDIALLGLERDTCLNNCLDGFKIMFANLSSRNQC